MKKLVVTLLVVGMMIGPAFAHPGSTDYKGGHTDRSTGEYHYHHGYSAHDHVDGVCPYDFDDRTGENSGSSGYGSSSSSTISTAYQTLQNGDRGNDVKLLQKRLNSLGYSVGTADGIFGPKTENAVRRYQQDNIMPETGIADKFVLMSLFPEWSPPATKVTPKPTMASGESIDEAAKSTRAQTTKNTRSKEEVFQRVVIVVTILITTSWIWYGIIELIIDSLSEESKQLRRALKPYNWLIRNYPNHLTYVEGRAFHAVKECAKYASAPEKQKGVMALKNAREWRVTPCPYCTTPLKLKCEILGLKAYPVGEPVIDPARKVCVETRSPVFYHKPGGICIPKNGAGYKLFYITEAEKRGSLPCPKCMQDCCVTVSKNR